jgi:very-short-patch-repair endonuclease
MSSHDVDAAIAALARRQHGAFNHAQLRDLGATDRMVDQRVGTGRWVRLVRGVYALASHPPTWQRQYKAAELSRPGSALCRRPAAMVHGLDGAKVLRPELWVPPGSSGRSSLARVHRGAEVPTTVVDGIRVTTLAQTLLDLLAEWQLDAVERAFDGALLAGRLDLRQCEERIQALAGTRRRDLAAYRALVGTRQAEGWAPSESELEHQLERVLRQLPAGLLVERQARFPWWPDAPHRTDALVSPWRLIVEGDGRRWHARVADFERDRWRDNVALAHGYRVARFSYAHVKERPSEVLDLIVAAGSWRTVAA